MLSAPDIKFEPPQRKLYPFNENTVALVAGDPYAQISICDETARVLKLKPRLRTKEIADLYAEAFSAHRRQLAEAKHLKPLGLDANSFMDRSQDFRSDLVSDLRLAMQREILDAETIIAGRDDTGAHLFVVTDPGIVTCADSVAFASIGTGKPHADSYFMMAHHTRNTHSHKVLLDTYIAKRRSEVSPTVGPTTDLFFIGNDGFREVADEIQQRLEAIREELDRRIATAADVATKDATAAINEYVEETARSRQPPQVESVNSEVAPPIKQKRVRVAAKKKINVQGAPDGGAGG